MTESRPTNVKQLDKLIDSWSEDEVGSRALVRRLRRLIGVTVLATMLDSLDEPNGNGPHLALKGGAAIEVRFGVDARATRDVDALVDLDLNEASSGSVSDSPPAGRGSQAPWGNAPRACVPASSQRLSAAR
jgi:hypothetical protein